MKSKSKIKRPTRPAVKKEQPRKDSRDKRVNFDNERVSKFERNAKQFENSNSPAWYAANPELMRAAASLPFSPVVGRKPPFQPLDYGENSPESVINTVPGVMTITWAPAVGQDEIDALNQASNSIYSFTVHANSRNTNYNASDELLVIYAGASVFSFLALGMRAYGIMRRYNQMDMYTPDGLLRAMGFDPSDLRANYANMWFQLNELIARTQQIWIPNTMPIIERWFWMNTHIYRDGDSVKSQYYLYTPACVPVYDETTNSTGGRLRMAGWFYNLQATTGMAASQKANTWADYVNLANTMINALINSEDRGIIFGDILKAYGSDRLYSMSAMPVDYTVEPVYDREVLTQIENLETFGQVPLSLYQDANLRLRMHWAQLPTVQLNFNSGFALTGPDISVLNFHQREVPTADQIMVATRMKAKGCYNAGVASATGTIYVGPATVGTEVAVGIHVASFRYNIAAGAINPIVNLDNIPQYFKNTLVGPNAATEIYPYDPFLGFNMYNWLPATTTPSNERHLIGYPLFCMYLLNAFDWAPWIYASKYTPHEDTNTSGDSTTQAVTLNKEWFPHTVMAVGDYDNYTYISYETLRKMHITAFYSELGVPAVL